ncbi:hypothetical protein SAMN05428957_106193 [Oryzisolibacter propanilivorax]|uniref:Uncharacterized protein n=1 Tax=Oryzisolibacter propanilivorax TaxID=1527607 RepID=A0A1G9TKG7_9BURK|nr:hypothetical protein [Oryzisolibacter propanilivorax]SDM48299.1 hypothetical protein SAMN05428957_106193 [Oryzisolibacter propanilivorax]
MSIKARLQRLEDAAAAAPELLRLFVTIVGREPQGFAAQHPAGPTVARLAGETVEALQARCTATAPAVTVWRSV